MNIINKSIPEPSAVSTINAIADGATVVGTPCIVYKYGEEGYKADSMALASGATLVGVIPGIAMASVSSGKAVEVAVAGKVAVAVSSGTVDDMVINISTSGGCTTTSAAGALGSKNIFGVYSAAKEIILVG